MTDGIDWVIMLTDDQPFDYTTFVDEIVIFFVFFLECMVSGCIRFSFLLINLRDIFYTFTCLEVFPICFLKVGYE